MTPVHQAKRIAYLDGLRALAVLLVLAFHAARHDPGIASQSGSPGLILLHEMCHGVDLFFILSGFCLAYPTLLRLHLARTTEFDLAAFGARRLVRIVPPYYAAIVLFVAIAVAGPYFGLHLQETMRQATAFDILRQALFIDANVHMLNISFWSLAVEFRWYFLFPLMLWLWVRSPRAFGVAGLAIYLAAMLTRAQSFDLLFLPTFMLGIVAADLDIKGHSITRLSVPLFAMFASFAAYKSAADGWDWIANPFWGVAMFWFVVAVSSSMLLRRLFSWRWLTITGVASYGIYLVHEPIVAIVEAQLQSSVGTGALFAIGGASAVVLGFAFSWVAERPFVSSSVRDKFVSKLERTLSPMFAELGLAPRIRLLRHETASMTEVA